MPETIEATYYAVAKLTNFTPEPNAYPVEMNLPAGCVGTFLVFDTLEGALEWADGDVGALRPVKVTVKP